MLKLEIRKINKVKSINHKSSKTHDLSSKTFEYNESDVLLS
jgi:hypothetical protein